MRSKLPASPVDTELYAALERNAKRVWKDAVLVPTYMLESGHRRHCLARAQRARLRHLSYPLDDDTLSRMHGTDETDRGRGHQAGRGVGREHASRGREEAATSSRDSC